MIREVTGLIEVCSAALLWVCDRQVLAAALLGTTMVGAVLALCLCFARQRG